MSIKVLGPLPAWDAAARQGKLVRADGSSAPVLLHSSDGTGPQSVEEARDEGRRIGRVRHDHVLHLKQVLAVHGEPFWVYDGFHGASLSRIVEVLAASGRRLPVRVVVDVGMHVVEALGDTWTTSHASGDRTVVHPGPTPGHVLINRSSQLKVAGFRAPAKGAVLNSPPGYAAPEGQLLAPALVYGVGALLAELLTGEVPPSAVNDADRHAAAVRRSLIRVLSRPGLRVPETVVDVVRGCLAFDPLKRPSLPRLAVQLERVGKDVPGPGLLDWSHKALPALWESLESPGLKVAPPVRSLPMAVGPLPHQSEALTEEAAPMTTEAGTVVERELAHDAPTVDDTEEVERTQEVTEGKAEVTVMKRPPDPVATASPPGQGVVGDPFGADSSFDRTVLSRPTVKPGPGAIAPIGEAGQLRAATVAGPGQELVDDDLPDWRPKRSRWPMALAAVALLGMAAGAWWWTQGGGASLLADAANADATDAVAIDDADIGEVEDGDAPTAPDGAAAGIADPDGTAAEDGTAAADADGTAAEDGTAAAEAAAAEAATAEAAAAEAAAAEAAAAEAAAAEAAAAEAAAAKAATTTTSKAPATSGRSSSSTRTSSGTAASSRSSASADDAADRAYIRPQTSGSTSSGSSEAGDAYVPPASTATTPPPQTVVIVPAPVETAAPQAPPYQLRFSSAYSAIARMEVQCHGGRTGTGLNVTISDAVPGPCKVQATTVDGGRLVAIVSATGDRSWSCFDNGERTCR